jgi:hypothetical protein
MAPDTTCKDSALDPSYRDRFETWRSKQGIENKLFGVVFGGLQIEVVG